MRILIIAGFVLFVLSVTIPFTSLASQHPCASPTPSPVTGTLTQPSPIAGNLFINEVLLQPLATWNCSEINGTSTPVNDTWVEIYNSQGVAYDLYGVNAALDSGPGTNPFYFPLGAAIAAHSFLVVFPRTSAEFLSSEKTSTVRLLISGAVVDEITTPSLPADTSYARTPDGSSTWQLLTTPTIGASNPLLQITATPSPTPRHLSTLTPHTSRASTSSNTGSKSESTSATTGGQTDTTQAASTSLPLVDGSQPTWNKMPMPDFASPSPVTDSSTTTATSTNSIQAPKTDSADITTKKIAITLVAIALACSLTWCWKLFITPGPQKQKR